MLNQEKNVGNGIGVNMQIKHVVITEDVANKIEHQHHVSDVEIDELFFNPEESPLIRRSYQGRYVALGRTFSGRYLTVVFRWISEDTVKVITARDMAKKEKQHYRRRRK